MKSNRDQDMRAEEQLGRFMDKYFYEKIKDKNKEGINFKRIVDKKIQLKGVDVCIEIENCQYFIDEKAALYYSNAMIQTFAFELEYLQPLYREVVQGWFINDELDTEFYMLIWPNIKCEQREGWKRKNLKYLQRDDFTIVEAMLIKKSVLRNRLEKNQLGKKRLLEYARELRKTGNREEKISDKIKIFYSYSLEEKPVNLVINKDMLKECAEAIFLISVDGYARIK